MEKDPQLAMMELVVTQAKAAQKILKIIRNPKKWCQYGLAEDIQGKQVRPLDAGAKKWSFLGAIYKARLSHQEALALKILLEVEEITISQLSNQLPHADILEMLNKTAKDLGKKTQLRDDYCSLMLKRVESIVAPKTEEAEHA